ncbi:hypothetical protein I1U85_26480 [Klebsiella pneumoniae]|uniref:tail fiber/spike domain-containing protein n=1 Tax=Klebsiella pneumoniae TaxID=573 RepID=UPI0015E7B04F|nr:hypothetical protein [Klebsiella pneumoniae]MBT9344978.1 hypothetical protein [Providencia stuartii]MBA2118833.1 hypothetical protein [Klebsiella pneumoniae subsp. pneumoniae]MBF8333931.1 hypothetical protein [Klebsiella pneumoniae]MCD1448672.1 hypothetical protein [Klebsiella pneumoniae]MCK0930810.1 hypothetical protein [Klebsiella pneumoniae]
MTRLPESSSWEEEIELISRSERVAGGLDGPANRPLKSLANRTRYLKDQADTADESIAEKVSAIKTFTEGAILESPREEILHGLYRLVWTGEFPKIVAAGSTPKGTGGVGVGCWAYTSDAVIRQELNSGEEGLGGDLIAANIHFSVRQILNRVRTLADAGMPRPVLGYDSDNDKLLYKAMQEMGDQELLLAGGIHISKKFRGIRRNNTPLSIRGGRGSTNDGSAWNAQIVGVSSGAELSRYGSHDGVGDYGDATLPPLESWEIVSATIGYTDKTVSIDAVIYRDMLSNLRVGDVLQTQHSSKCWGIVSSINATTGVITVTDWGRNGASITPASDGSGFYANFINKAWAFNRNVLIPSDAAGNNAVIGELGIQNKKSGMANVNGVDTVLLAGSTYGGTAAYLARSGAAELGWQYGFRSEGARFNFMSASGNLQPFAGFIDRSNAVCGMKFYKNNTYSMLWSTSSDQTDISFANSPAIIGPTGVVYRQPRRVVVFSESASIGALYPTILITTPGITITMPAVADTPIAGIEYTLMIMKAGTYYIKAFNSETAVSGYSTYTLVVTTDRKKYSVLWDGTYWQVLEG